MQQLKQIGDPSVYVATPAKKPVSNEVLLEA